MRSLQWALWGVGLVLQCAVLAAIVYRRHVREFRAVFIYVAVLLLTTITDIVAFYTLDRVHPLYPKYYWVAELLRQTTLFALVVSLVNAVVRRAESPPKLLRHAVPLAVLFWLGNLAFTHQSGLNAWMTDLVRNLSFMTAVLDLGVWFALISGGARDTRRLLIAGALGLQMTGEAIGQSIRHMFPQSKATLAGLLFVVFAHFLCLGIWCYALARKPRTAEAVAAPPQPLTGS